MDIDSLEDDLVALFASMVEALSAVDNKLNSLRVDEFVDEDYEDSYIDHRHLQVQLDASVVDWVVDNMDDLV